MFKNNPPTLNPKPRYNLREGLVGDEEACYQVEGTV